MSVQITAPTSKVDVVKVPSNFHAAGTVSAPDSTVTCKLVKGDAHYASVTYPTPGKWVAFFPNVPLGAGYQLYAIGNSGSSDGPIQITVDAMGVDPYDPQNA